MRLQQTVDPIEIARAALSLPVEPQSASVAVDTLRRLSRSLTSRHHLDNPRIARHPALADSGAVEHLTAVLAQGSSQECAAGIRALGSLAPLAPSGATAVEELVGRLLSRYTETPGADSCNDDNASPSSLSQQELSGVHWACLTHGLPVPHALDTLVDALAAGAAAGNAAGAKLPFRVLPGLAKGVVTVAELMGEVEFQGDHVTTASGQVVKERRLTAWQTLDGSSSNDPPSDSSSGNGTKGVRTHHDSGNAASTAAATVKGEGHSRGQTGKGLSLSSEAAAAAAGGVGDFSYSGKVMPAKAFTPCVAKVCAAVSKVTGQQYDGCLVNLYPDGSSGMRYHSDPDQGDLWGFDTVVVSVGETRRFCFREAPLKAGTKSAPSSASGGGGGSSSSGGAKSSGSSSPRSSGSAVHAFHVFDGDVVHMFGDCQERFQHSVMKATDGSKQLRPSKPQPHRRKSGGGQSGEKAEGKQAGAKKNELRQEGKEVRGSGGGGQASDGSALSKRSEQHGPRASLVFKQSQKFLMGGLPG